MELTGINLFQSNDSTTTAATGGFKLSNSEVASKKLTEYFGNLKTQSNKIDNGDSITAKIRKIFDELGAYFDNKTNRVKYTPGRHVTNNGNSATTVNNDGDVIKEEFYINEPEKKFSIESETGKRIYKDNNNKVCFTVEYSSEADYKDDNNNTVSTSKETVKDARGNILYIKIIQKTTEFEKLDRNSYRTNYEYKVTYQDANGKEINESEALARRNKHCTQSMKEGLERTDDLERRRYR